MSIIDNDNATWKNRTQREAGNHRNSNITQSERQLLLHRLLAPAVTTNME